MPGGTHADGAGRNAPPPTGAKFTTLQKWLLLAWVILYGFVEIRDVRSLRRRCEALPPFLKEDRGGFWAAMLR